MPARCVRNPAEQPADAYWSIVSDLVSLIDRTRGYHLINTFVEPAPSAEANVVILDDVAPEQAPEVVLLSDCNLRLREALHFLLEARASRKLPAAGSAEASDRRENFAVAAQGA
jgi:hypothetical protein